MPRIIPEKNPHICSLVIHFQVDIRLEFHKYDLTPMKKEITYGNFWTSYGTSLV